MAKAPVKFVIIPEPMFIAMCKAIKEQEKSRGAGNSLINTPAPVPELPEAVESMDGGGASTDLPSVISLAPNDSQDPLPEPSELVQKEIGEPSKKKKRNRKRRKKICKEGATQILAKIIQ